MTADARKVTRRRLARPVAVAAVIAGLAALGWFSYQRCWGPDAWKSGYDDAPRGVDEEGNPWIGAQHPTTVIHEFMDYECPHCPMAHKHLRGVIASNLDRIRLVRHDYARMPCAPNSATNRRERCLLVRAGLCFARDGRFWDWNDAVVEHPRPLSGPARKTFAVDTAVRLGADAGELDECMYSDEIVEKAQTVYRDARRRRVMETPTYFVDDEPHDLNELLDLLDERF
jgi:protein-disulfide isomerase